MFGRFGKFGRFEWLPAVLAAVAFVVCFAAFIWQFIAYQKNVKAWSEADLKSRAELAASTLAEPLRTLDFKAIQKVADRLKADGLRLRITESPFGVSESDCRTGFFDTCGEPYPADGPCMFKVAQTGDFFVGVGRPVAKMLLPFLGSLLVIALAVLVGVAGVLLFFFVTYRQRVRIRELAKLEKFRREFIADVSHEIKTPLSGILGAVDLIRDQGSGIRDQGMVERLIEMIRRESRRLNGLVQSILDLARLEREGDVLDITEFDLAEMLKELAVKYGVRYDGSDRQENIVFGDATLILQAVSNLVENAKRHSGTDDIAISLTWFDGWAHVIVEDHGIGIPPEHATRIFERFHRVDPARAAETGGAGLGLAIVRQVARLHGGDVTLTPAEPTGCRFAFSIPM